MAMAQTPVELLKLKLQSDNQVVRDIRFYGTDIDPNTSAVDEQFTLTIDGQNVPINPELARRLEGLRRSFSYDSLSGGIQVGQPGSPMCLMAGPARGMILETRYLTYENYKITNSGMKPVLTVAQNCLFTSKISPQNATAREEARAALEILFTLSHSLPQGS
ncbi:hypothetical protein [Gloeomargarita lithophora]|nr:hypothetical protein [Gloeomargarita lithophora]